MLVELGYRVVVCKAYLEKYCIKRAGYDAQLSTLVKTEKPFPPRTCGDRVIAVRARHTEASGCELVRRFRDVCVMAELVGLGKML